MDINKTVKILEKSNSTRFVTIINQIDLIFLQIQIFQQTLMLLTNIDKRI